MNIEEIYKGIFDDLCHYVYTIVKDQSASQDIVQDVFLKILNKNNVSEIKALRPYLYTSVYNASIDFINKQKKINSAVSEISNLSNNESNSSNEHENIKELIENVLNELPPTCKEVFILAKRDGKKYAEIATHLNVSIKTVEAHMTNAFKKIKKYIDSNNIKNSFWILVLFNVVL